MSDNIHPPGTAEVIAAKDIAAVLFQRSILTKADGTDIDPATAAAQTTGNASLAAIDAKLPALVGGAVPVTLGAATIDLGATSLAALETIELGATSLAALESVTTSGPLTDAQLRAAAVPVSLDAAALAALETIELGASTIASLTTGGGLTDAQLRATPVPVSGTVELGGTALAALESITVGGTVDLGATSLAALESITAAGPLTDTQLRATAVPVSAASLPLPTGAAAEASLAAMSAKVPALGQALAAASTPVVLTAAQVTTLTPPAYSYLSSPSQSPYGLFAKIDPFGALAVSGATTPLFNDPFDTVVLDTVNRWTTSGTTRPTISNGSAVASLGATNSVSSVLVSQPVFSPTTQPFFVAGQLTVGAQQTNPNAHRWFGMGAVTSYAASTPITNGHGFEVDVTGALNAVVYIAGVRYVVNSTDPALITAPGSWAADMTMSNYGATLTWPPSGVAIVLVRYYNGYAYFYMAGSATGFDVPIGVASWVPFATSYPLRFAAITTPAVSTVMATTFSLAGFIMGTSDGSNITVSDPTNPWRQAGVNVTMPLGSDGGLSVRQVPSDMFRTSFADAYTGAVTPEFLLLQTGTGMAINQTGGNLVLTSGTTANSETMIRSVKSFRGAITFRFKSILSQRIVNNTFIVELADLVGELLAYTINSATSVTVTFAQVNPFTSINVGQFVNLGVIAGTAGLPGRFAIASVSGLTVTFTVASWPASGSGTLTLYGWSYIRANYNGTTATAVGFDTQRRGWNSGDSALTTLTSASPGHIVAIETDNAFVDFSDSLVATGATPAFTSRGSRLENIPDDSLTLYLFVRALNGTTNPATTTTWTMGLLQVEQMGNHKVFLAGSVNSSVNRSIPITGAVTVSSGTVTTVSTVTAVTTLTTLANGQTAHSAASTGSPVRVAGRVATAAETTLVAGDAADMQTTTGGALVAKLFAVPELDWSYVAASGGISNTTTAVTMKAAVASVRNYITSMQISSDALGAATELAVRDGAAGTVIWRMKIGTAGIVGGLNVEFTNPIKSTVNTLLEVVTLTASITGAVFVNAQGYVAV